ncbi:MAG: IMP dehydrogenase [Chlamydiota bacterium]|jgi:IMP dehydrogenase
MRIHDFFQKFEGESFTYNDLICLPDFINFSMEEINLTSKITREITLRTPIISSPMDTVTEADLAIALALQGGLGIIHYNMNPQDQLDQVQKVKKFKNGFISDPITLSPSSTIRDVVLIKKEHGYSIVPITEDGKPHSKFLGLVTKYDYSTLSLEDLEKPVWERMIPLERLSTVVFEEFYSDGYFDLVKANNRLLDSHQAALPIIDRLGNLRYLMTRSDLQKHQNYPLATTNSSQVLRVGAAIETWHNKAVERLEALEKHVDLVIFDTSQGHSSYLVDLIKFTKSKYPHLQIIGGNVVSSDACEALIKAGADGIRVGMGSGSICTTQEVGGVGRAQASAVYNCAQICKKKSIPLIADGGITGSSDMVKAFILGADSVMLGSLLASTSEAPGKCQIKNGILLKEYRGMGSSKAMQKGSSFRYSTQNATIKIPEGVCGAVPSKGSISEWVPCLIQGVKQGFHKLGYKNFSELRCAFLDNKLMLEKRSDEAKKEGSVHSLYEVMQDAPPTFSKSHHEDLINV